MLAGLAVGLAVLLVHIRIYAFSCDDAFISFRYARNLAHGFGLVFNPGQERVEGYSNFLWVLILAAFDRLGALPEKAAPVLSIGATLVLWGLVAARAAREARPAWTALVAPLLLAVNRSFAVWATSGLETRLFELLVVGGALRLDDEVSGASRGERRVPLAGTLFALAALTRPDGLLLSACAFGCGALATARREPRARVRFALGWLPFAVLVGGHYLFRHAYYGDWLPNTYYAKVGGRTWWDAGLRYLAAFALEYGAVLWIPLLISGVRSTMRNGRGFAPALAAAMLVPYALYIAAVGGDHFEYRPLDLALPFLFLGLGRGAGAVAAGIAGRTGRLSTSPTRTAAVAAYLIVLAWAGVEIPWRSHVEFPKLYIPGFPGPPSYQSDGFLEPRRDLLYRTPPFSWAARTHSRLLRELSEHFIGLRQEEHAHFLTLVTAEGRRLHQLVEEGLLPADTYIATGCVGAIPYYSDLRTLDRLGLTDRFVAHSAPGSVRIMAHERSATFDYGRERGVDLWAANNVYFLFPSTSQNPINLRLAGKPFYAAHVAPEELLLAVFPKGFDDAVRRFPRLRFQDGFSDSFLIPYIGHGIARLRDSLATHPTDDMARRDLAAFLLARGEFAEALAAYHEVLLRTPDDERALLDSGLCLHRLHRDPEARPLIERLLAIGIERADESLVRRARGLLEQL